MEPTIRHARRKLPRGPIRDRPLCTCMGTNADLTIDRRKDADYAERCIRHISDAELVGAMDRAHLGSPADAEVYEAWGGFWNTVLDRGRFLGDGDLLMTADEA